MLVADEPCTEGLDNIKADLAMTYKNLLMRVASAPIVPSVTSKLSIGSAWGTTSRAFREILGTSISVRGPACRLVSEVRPLNNEYALVSSAWIILGRNDVESLNMYNSRGQEFSMDGFTLSGAFGHRLRSSGGDQIEAVVRVLREDQSTRRAVAYIGRNEDLLNETRDFPCGSVIQFFVRQSKLDVVVYMRSQSLFGVFPYDLVNFRYLQEYVGWRIGASIGTTYFTFGSLHVYEDEMARIDAFVQERTTRFVKLTPIRWDSLSTLYAEWTGDRDGVFRLRDYARQAR